MRDLAMPVQSSNQLSYEATDWWTHKLLAPTINRLIAQLVDEERRKGILRSRLQTPLKSWIFQASPSNC